MAVTLKFCLTTCKCCQWEGTHSPVTLFPPGMVVMEHLHDVFGALHEEDMQRQGPVCMLLNQCFSFSLLLVMCFQKTTMWKVGAFYLIFQLSFAFYFLVLIEYASNVDGKLNFLLSVGWCLGCVSLFI